MARQIHAKITGDASDYVSATKAAGKGTDGFARAQEAAGKSSLSFRDKIRTIAKPANLGRIALKKMGDGARAVGRRLATAARGVARFAGRLAKVGFKAFAAGAGIAGGALVALTAKGLQNVDLLTKQARRSGISTEKLAGLRLAAEQTGVANAQFDKVLLKMQKSVNDLSRGLSTQKDAFDSIGLSIDDLQGKSPDKQFEIISQALKDTADQTTKVGAAFDILGGKGTALLTTIELGAEGLAEYQRKAEILGLTLSDKTAQGVERFNDSLDLVKQSVTGLSRQLAARMAPILVNITDRFYSWLESVGGVNAILDKLVMVIRNVWSWISQNLVPIFVVLYERVVVMYQAIGGFIGGLNALFKGTGQGVTVFQALAKVLQFVFGIIGKIITLMAKGLLNVIVRSINMFERFVFEMKSGWKEAMASIRLGIVSFEAAWDTAVAFIGFIFSNLAVDMKQAFFGAVNLVIAGINKVIGALNLLPGVSIDALGKVGQDFDAVAEKADNAAKFQQKIAMGIDKVKQASEELIQIKIQNDAEEDRLEAKWKARTERVLQGYEDTSNLVGEIAGKIRNTPNAIAKMFGDSDGGPNKQEIAALLGGFHRTVQDTASAANQVAESMVDVEDATKGANQELDKTSEKAKGLVGHFKDILGSIGSIFGVNTGGLAGAFEAIGKQKDNIAAVFKNIGRLPGLLANGLKGIGGAIKNLFKTVEDAEGNKTGFFGRVAGFLGPIGSIIQAGKAIFDFGKQLFGDKSDRVSVGVRAGGPRNAALDIGQQVTGASGLQLQAVSRRAGAEGDRVALSLRDQFLKIDNALTQAFSDLGVTIDLAGRHLAPGPAGDDLRPSAVHNIFGSVAYDTVDQAQIDNAASQFVQAWADAVLPQLPDKLQSILGSVATDTESWINTLEGLLVDYGKLTSIDLARPAQTVLTGFQKAVKSTNDALSSLELDYTAQNHHALTEALRVQREEAQKLIDTYYEVSQSISSVTASTTATIQDELRTDAERLVHRQDELRKIEDLIATTTDPERLNSLVQQANALVLDIFQRQRADITNQFTSRYGSLEGWSAGIQEQYDEIVEGLGADLIKTLAEIEEKSQEQIVKGIGEIAEQQAQTLEETLRVNLIPAIEQANSQQSEAADKQVSAAEAMAIAADNMVTAVDALRETLGKTPEENQAIENLVIQFGEFLTDFRSYLGIFDGVELDPRDRTQITVDTEVNV